MLDVNSGAIHLVDELVYKLLDFIEAPMDEICPQTAIDVLSGEFGEERVREAYSEVYKLYSEDQLFSSDDTKRFSEDLAASPVKAMCLNVSHDCNLRCDYCFAGRGNYSGERLLMSAETGFRAIDFLIAHSQGREFLEVDFFGGEPLMNLDVVKKVVNYARSKEKEHNKTFRFTITTNGVLLNDEAISYINREMSNVVLSLDGRREVNDRVRRHVNGSGCYDYVACRFQDMVSARGEKEYYVRATFTAYNKDFAQDVLALAALGFDQISVEPVVADESMPYALKESDLPEIFNEYENLAQKILDAKDRGESFNFFHFMLDFEQGPCVIKRLRGCGSGNEYLAVTPEGDIYPCHQFIGHDSWKMGSVHSGELDTEIKERFANVSIYHKPDCRECWAKFYCSGGCHANSFIYEGDILKSHKLSCELERKRVECAIALKAELMMREE